MPNFDDFRANKSSASLRAQLRKKIDALVETLKVKEAPVAGTTTIATGGPREIENLKIEIERLKVIERNMDDNTGYRLTLPELVYLGY